jgi:hypothetical protein
MCDAMRTGPAGFHIAERAEIAAAARPPLYLSLVFHSITYLYTPVILERYVPTLHLM